MNLFAMHRLHRLKTLIIKFTSNRSAERNTCRYLTDKQAIKKA